MCVWTGIAYRNASVLPGRIGDRSSRAVSTAGVPRPRIVGLSGGVLDPAAPTPRDFASTIGPRDGPVTEPHLETGPY